VASASITLDEAVDLARTGDVWLFRGHPVADRAIQVATNSPVNHVGMAVAVRAGTTRAASGAVTASASPPGSGSAARSAWLSRRVSEFASRYDLVDCPT
jgi:hypothetical protein